MLFAWVWIIHFSLAGALQGPASGIWQRKSRDDFVFQRKSTRLYNSMDQLLLYADLTQKLYEKYHQQFRKDQQSQRSSSEKGAANAVSIQIQPLYDSPADPQQLTINIDVLQLGSAFVTSFIIVKVSSWFKKLFQGESAPPAATASQTPPIANSTPPPQQQQQQQAGLQTQFAEVIYTPPPSNQRSGAWQALSPEEDSARQKSFRNVIDTTADTTNSSQDRYDGEEEEIEESGRSVRELLEDSPFGFLCKIRKRLIEINE